MLNYLGCLLMDLLQKFEKKKNPSCLMRCRLFNDNFFSTQSFLIFQRPKWLMKKLKHRQKLIICILDISTYQTKIKMISPKTQIIDRQVSLFTNIILMSKVCLTLYCQIIYENWCQTTQGLKIKHFFFFLRSIFWQP